MNQTIAYTNVKRESDVVTFNYRTGVLDWKASHGTGGLLNYQSAAGDKIQINWDDPEQPVMYHGW